MSHFFTFFTNANGVITDANLSDEIAKAISAHFDYSSVFIYSHGWWTNANDAANSYNRFSIGFANRLLLNSALPNGTVPASSLNVGIHWPSTLSEDGGALEEFLKPASFFTMEKRADDVGETGVNGILLSILQQWTRQRKGRLTINFIGHSFGTKVICSALKALTVSCARKPAFCQFFDNVHFNLVLLQAAFDNNDFEFGEHYADIPKLHNLRVLVTKSNLDTALEKYYPAAHFLEILKAERTNRTALGYSGPTSAAIAAFGGSDDVAVDANCDFSTAPAFPNRLVVADLSRLHSANPRNAASAASGHHNDIYYDEIYGLIARFLY